VGILKGEGFKNLSFDLILSLPGEDVEKVKFSLAEAMRLEPQHISLYELVIEKKTMFSSLVEKGKLILPDENAQLAMLSYARDFLKGQGFSHYELLSYAKPGFQSRHNLIYWANEDYLGLGPGAFSYFDGRRFRNSDSVDQYMRKIESDDWTASEEESLSEEKKEIESFLLALRLEQGASLDRFGGLVSRMKSLIQDLEAKGLLLKDAKRVALTPRGQLFSETVFSELSGVD
jgi:oxygen-independent coproporphyrinogen-3 oxidase